MPPNSGMAVASPSNSVNKSSLTRTPLAPPVTLEATLYITCNGVTKMYKLDEVSVNQNYSQYNPGVVNISGQGTELDVQFNEDMISAHTGKKGV